MDFEERLQAIAQTVELLAGMQLATERNLAKLEQAVEHYVTDFAVGMSKLQETMNRFAHIPVAHEERLDKLESGQKN